MLIKITGGRIPPPALLLAVSFSFLEAQPLIHQYWRHQFPLLSHLQVYLLCLFEIVLTFWILFHLLIFSYA